MELFVMSGAFMTGKTTWIERMLLKAGIPVKSENPALMGAALGSSKGMPTIAGVYTPAVFRDGEKTGIDATLLPSCERFPFATRRGSASGKARPDGREKLSWDFDEGTLDRINGHMRANAVCGLLVVDELGPLELVRNGGYTAALDLLDEEAVPTALVVVRPALLDAARERWGSFGLLGTDASVDDFLSSLRRS